MSIDFQPKRLTNAEAKYVRKTLYLLQATMVVYELLELVFGCHADKSLNSTVTVSLL